MLLMITDIQVIIALGFHLFPSRTEKLSPTAPMVLHLVVGEQVVATFFLKFPWFLQTEGTFFVYICLSLFGPGYRGGYRRFSALFYALRVSVRPNAICVAIERVVHIISNCLIFVFRLNLAYSSLALKNIERAVYFQLVCNYIRVRYKSIIANLFFAQLTPFNCF